MFVCSCGDQASCDGCEPYMRAKRRTVSLSAATLTTKSSPARTVVLSSATFSRGAWLSITKLFVSWYALPSRSVIKRRHRYVPSGSHEGARNRTSQTPSACKNVSGNVSPNGNTANTELIDSFVFTLKTGSPGWINRGRNNARGAAMNAVYG